MFGIGSGPFGEQDEQQDQGLNTGDQLVGRIMGAEYNLAVQRQGAASASPMGILASMLGEQLQQRDGRLW